MGQIHKRLDRLENVGKRQPQNVPNVYRRERDSVAVQRICDEVTRLQEGERDRESMKKKENDQEKESEKIKSEEKEKEKGRENRERK